MFFKKQLLTKFELETLLMGGDDDMEKQATYPGPQTKASILSAAIAADLQHLRGL